MIEKDLEYTGEYSSPPYERYKDNREIFQEAGNTLTEGLYAALEGRLTILGIPKETIRTVYYVDNYGDDDVILNRLIGMGLERNVASTILNECRAEAENALRKEILAKDLSEDVVSSVLNYVIVIQRVRTAGAANDDDNHDLWARQQMYQLGAAGENCPLHYLDAVIGAATFLIAQHPDPTTGTFNIYKRFSQPGGHIHLREVVESLEKKGLEPNQVRAILNLHKHYGANLGSAYLALLQHAHELVDYKGGVLQLVADFADRKISPALQVAIVSQTENHVDYPGGSLQLAMDLSERHISPPLQEALISNWSYLKDYDKGIIQLALDLVAAGFSLAMQLNLVRQLVNRGISPSEPARPYILGLRKLYVVNPECVSKEFGSEYGKLAYYALVAPTPQKTLLALVTDTAAEKLPDLSSEHRIKLFSALLVLIQYPRYEYYREVAFLVANRAAEMELGAFDNAVMQINQLAQMFDRSGSNSNPKGALPLATNLAQDVVAIANQDQPQMKARWYDNLIYRGGRSRRYYARIASSY
jgi:hypothetical protein